MIWRAMFIYFALLYIWVRHHHFLWWIFFFLHVPRFSVKNKVRYKLLHIDIKDSRLSNVDWDRNRSRFSWNVTYPILNQLLNPLLNQFMNPLLNLFINPLINQLINPLLNQLINPLLNQLRWSLNRLIAKFP